MNRRHFLAAAGAAAAALPINAASAGGDERRFFEWIRFESINNDDKGRLDRWLKEAVLPGLNRLGLEPIGVFRPRFGAGGGDTFVLVEHASIDSFLHAWDRLWNDKDVQRAAGELFDPPQSQPLFHRMEKTLLRAFSRLPHLNIPPHVRGKIGRIFEVRIYESSTYKKAELKREMFNEGGEIDLFKKTGLNPMMFGETLAGARMPNLTYILAFESPEEQAQAWERFRTSEEWNQMKDNPRWRDTVSTITDFILVPTAYSQI